MRQSAHCYMLYSIYELLFGNNLDSDEKNIAASLLPIISYSNTVQDDGNKCQADLLTKYKKHHID